MPNMSSVLPAGLRRLHIWHCLGNAKCAICVTLQVIPVHKRHCIPSSKYDIFTQNIRRYLIPVCHRYYLRGLRRLHIWHCLGNAKYAICVTPQVIPVHKRHCIPSSKYDIRHKTLFNTGVSLVLPAGLRRLHIWHCLGNAKCAICVTLQVIPTA